VGRFQIQDPGDTLDWSNDWTDFLAGGDSISSRQWTINPDTSPTLLTNATTAAVKVAGLTKGLTYILTEAITTANGVVGERSIVIRCEDL
jgi:hypothetical protein